ncbi:DUF2956 domain-containing protein [Shewanella sp. AS1]|uniref:DUF2956 domain-containing protein n=1 Tax=Shewanella sp. AS1 TaxID=2907626 RepID=UPI001F2B6644|nr:DUF2956 domain-containing protein [Shewanella sp. AS1]MCE9677770.1 DUF2956 domain-containing protein [Shewanella sp. AS1]
MSKASSNKNISEATRQDALKMAKATQKPGQSKEQTKLIAQGIEKGIAEYKKQQKSKARDRDKARKSELKAKQRHLPESDSGSDHAEQPSTSRLPWLLLLLSWIGFALYLLVK